MRNKLGQKAENLALQYLLNKGYSLIARNYRHPFGEIDLIMLDHGELVFVEVKARHSSHWGEPFTAVNRQKLKKIRKTAAAFFQTYPTHPQFGRIDVVSITEKPWSVTHFQNVDE